MEYTKEKIKEDQRGPYTALVRKFRESDRWHVMVLHQNDMDLEKYVNTRTFDTQRVYRGISSMAGGWVESQEEDLSRKRVIIGDIDRHIVQPKFIRSIVQRALKDPIGPVDD